MIQEKIDNAINFIREARDEADDLSERILYFVVFIFMGVGIITLGFIFCMLVFTFPRVFIPIYFSIFVLWQGYKRL